MTPIPENSPPSPPPIIDNPTQAHLPYAAPNVVNTPRILIPDGWTNIECFSLDPARLPKFILITSLLRIGFLLAPPPVLLLFFFLFQPHRNWAEFFGFALFLLIFYVIYIPISIIRFVFRTRRAWNVSQLILADQGFLLTQLKGSPKRINRDEVTRIVDAYDAFRVHLNRSHVNVAKRFLNFDRIKSRLAQWKPIEPGEGLLGVSSILLLNLIFIVAIIALYFVGAMSPNRNTIAICAVATFLLSLFFIFRIYLNRATRLATRLSVLIYLIIPLHLAYCYFFERT